MEIIPKENSDIIPKGNLDIIPRENSDIVSIEETDIITDCLSSPTGEIDYFGNYDCNLTNSRLSAQTSTIRYSAGSALCVAHQIDINPWFSRRVTCMIFLDFFHWTFTMVLPILSAYFAWGGHYIYISYLIIFFLIEIWIVYPFREFWIYATTHTHVFGISIHWRIALLADGIVGGLARADTYTDICFIITAWRCNSRYWIPSLVLAILGITIVQCLIVGTAISLRIFSATDYSTEHLRSLSRHTDSIILNNWFISITKGEKKNTYDAVAFDATMSTIRFLTEDFLQSALQIAFLFEQKFDPFVLLSILLALLLSFVRVMKSIRDGSFKRAYYYFYFKWAVNNLQLNPKNRHIIEIIE